VYVKLWAQTRAIATVGPALDATPVRLGGSQQRQVEVRDERVREDRHGLAGRARGFVNDQVVEGFAVGDERGEIRFRSPRSHRGSAAEARAVVRRL
jgi:hypothetical protein